MDIAPHSFDASQRSEEHDRVLHTSMQGWRRIGPLESMFLIHRHVFEGKSPWCHSHTHHPQQPEAVRQHSTSEAAHHPAVASTAPLTSADQAWQRAGTALSTLTHCTSKRLWSCYGCCVGFGLLTCCLALPATERCWCCARASTEGISSHS